MNGLSVYVNFFNSSQNHCRKDLPKTRQIKFIQNSSRAIVVKMFWLNSNSNQMLCGFPFKKF
jgi:hypothetical protein